MRKQLEHIGLASWPKLTGGKGLHVVVPFEPEHGWQVVYETSRRICESLVRDQPNELTLAFATKGRTRKILLDYKRNHRAAVAVAAYSARAHPAGTVSLPIRWSELDPQVHSDAFDLNTARARIRRQAEDPWSQFWTCRQRLRPQ